MKAICKKDHEQPNGQGGFKKYKAGKEYTVEEIDAALFLPIKDTKIKTGGKIK